MATVWLSGRLVRTILCLARQPRWGFLRDAANHSRLLPGCPDRSLRGGEDALRPRPLHGHRGDCLGCVPGAGLDDETDQDATADAFEVLRFIATKRLAAGRLTVIDATNVRPEDRAVAPGTGPEYHALAVAIVFDLPDDLCQAHNRQRPERDFGGRSSGGRPSSSAVAAGLKREGFRYVYTFTTPEEVRQPPSSGSRSGPIAGTSTAPSTLSATSTGVLTNSSALLQRLGYAMAVEPDAPARHLPCHASRRSQGRFSGRSGRSGAAHS